MAYSSRGDLANEILFPSLETQSISLAPDAYTWASGNDEPLLMWLG